MVSVQKVPSTETRPAPHYGDIVMARRDIVPEPRFDYRRNDTPRRSDIPLGTLGLVRGRVLGQHKLFVDFQVCECYVMEEDISVVDLSDWETLAAEFEIGANLIHLAISQKMVIFDLQAQVSKMCRRFQNLERTYVEQLDTMRGDRDALQAALDAAEEQRDGLRDSLSEMEYLERARHLSKAGRAAVRWTEGPVGDNSLEDNGWTFGGERTDPETHTPLAWRWFQDRESDSSQDGC